MNLVQKLPIGLGLACMMMLSSCSKEDVSAPEPQVGGVNESSGLREDGGLFALPQFAPTNGPTGQGLYATGWYKNYGALPVSPQLLPSGTSNLTHLWGDSGLPWAKALQSIPGIPSSYSFITITAESKVGAPNSSIAEATIKHLKPGKLYALTVYFASTMRNTTMNQLAPTYAKEVLYVVSKHKSDLWADGNVFASYVALGGKEAMWVKETIYIKAETNEMTINFSGRTPQQGQYGYVNILVDKNSIKEVN